jgi:threonine dehydratase
MSALKLVISRAKQVIVEPAPAAPVAALLTGKSASRHGANCVAILTGGNIDLDRLKELL